MAKLILLVCFLFGAVSAALAQQGFRVSVLNDADEPLIGAYIYVNEKAEAVTDTLGRAIISSEKLKIGDSISVSYVATKGQSLVVDQVMLIKGEYRFILPESHGTLHADAVIVKANIKRLYRRSLPMKKRPPYFYYGLYSTHFAMNITNPGDSLPSHWVAGRMDGVFTSFYILGQIFPTRYDSFFDSPSPDPAVLDSLQRSGFSEGFVNDLPLEITTSDDTTNLEHTLKYFLPRALRANADALWKVYSPEPNSTDKKMYPNGKFNYGYLGKDKDTTTFRLTYSGYVAGTTLEVVVKSNVADRINREIVEVALSFKDTINGTNYYVKAKTRYERIWEHICQHLPKSWIYHIPFELEYSITESDGTRINITMSNYNIRSIFERLKVHFYEIYKQYPRRFRASSGQWKREVLLDFYYNEIDRYLQRVVRREQKLKEKQPKKGVKTSSIFDN